MAAGSIDGAYFAYARRYRDFLAQRGIELDVRETAGSIENLGLLRDPESGVQVALVQGGTSGPEDHEEEAPLSSLGSLFSEPLWIFYRGNRELMRLDELVELNVAIGPEGSGTRSLAIRLFADIGMVDRPNWLDLSGQEAADALVAGDIDAALYVTSPDSAIIAGLAAAPDLRLANLARAEGLAQRHRFLTLVTVHRGALNLQTDMPPFDTTLPAPTANLVANDALHPTLVSLFMQALADVHGLTGPFHEAGTYPSAAHLEFPLRAEARRFLERGPPFLQRFLPFWVADFIDRAVVLLIPLVALALPLFRIFPPFYAWRMRSRVNRWYKEVEAAEDTYRANPTQEAKQAAQKRLQEIDQAALDVEVPLTYAHTVYRLRQHIALVIGRL